MIPKLSISNLCFSYGAHPVFRGIDLTIDPGEIVGLMGPNGAGKSTLIRLLCGSMVPGSGRMLLDGRPLMDFSPRERAKQVAMVPQATHIPFSFSALEVVLMGRAPYLPRFGFESRQDIQAALDAMAKTDCFALTGRDINTLSGGERQRVILARALAQNPSLILLDEPCTFLDIRHTTEFIDRLTQLNREGLTIVCAIHDLNVAASFCHRLILLKEGRIAAQGRPVDIINPHTIRQVFDIGIHVDRDGHTGLPYCVPRRNTHNPA
jgi:iron complex transport system ATP-binding protein